MNGVKIVFLFMVSSLTMLYSDNALSETTVYLPLTDDAWIKETEPDRTTGDHSRLVLGSGRLYLAKGESIKRSLVRFDAAGIEGKEVLRASLMVYVDWLNAPGAIHAYPIVSSWSEDSVTWRTEPPHRPMSTETVPTSHLFEADKGSYVSIDVTDIAQEWADGTLPDAGLKLVTAESTQFITLDSKEAGMPRHPVMLKVSFVDSWGAPPDGGDTPIVIDLSSGGTVIDQPGYYVLDRNWAFDRPCTNPTGTGAYISIESNNVTIDLQGFSITTYGCGLVVWVKAAHATIRNGRIFSIHNEGVVGGAYTQIENVSAADVTVGMHSTIVNSTIDRILSLRDGSRLINSRVRCVEPWGYCVDADSADNVEITGNWISLTEDRVGSAMIVGSDSIVSNNLIDIYATGAPPPHGIQVVGDGSTVADNIFTGTRFNTTIQIDGKRNIVTGNKRLGANSSADTVGIEFLQDGNFYGDNRMSALTPFLVEGTIQTDLGGNTSY